MTRVICAMALQRYIEGRRGRQDGDLEALIRQKKTRQRPNLGFLAYKQRDV